MTARARADAPTATDPAAGGPLPPAGLYVHFPFCLSLCPYCDFVVVAGAAARGPRNRIAEFVEALRTEVELRADALDEQFGTSRPALDTLYLGGGTPSLLASETVAGLVDLVRDRFGLADDAEITLEANPGPDDRGDPVAFAQAGVNRISFGAQSLDPLELRRLGRRHLPADVADAVARARAAGIASVNLDLLYDVPGQTPETFVASLDAALALDPDHLSVYALTLDDPSAEGLTGPLGDHLPTTAGARRWRQRASAEQDDDRAADQYRHAVERLAAAGFEAYEISNWARHGHRSRHNLGYWRRLPYDAVGPGAHAFDGVVRRWNAARLEGYVAGLAGANGARPSLPPGDSERIGPAAAAAERVILGLRMGDGIPSVEATRPPLADEIGWARQAGLVADVDDRIALTVQGRLLSNELFARLI